MARRYFALNWDSSTVLVNNYPELRTQILKKAASYVRSEFLTVNPEARVFLIRFSVIREVRDCEFMEIE
jgi:hypothetical protein